MMLEGGEHILERLKKARELRGYKIPEFAALIDISPSSLKNWESGAVDPPCSKVAMAAQILNVSMDYLTGRVDTLAYELSLTEPIAVEQLRVMHGLPVWLEQNGSGFALVDAIGQKLTFHDGRICPFESITGEVRAFPPGFALGLHGIGAPLDAEELTTHDRIWLEPLSSDEHLRQELRGWYQVRNAGRYAENEYGHRFYMASYGATWLAFINNSFS